MARQNDDQKLCQAAEVDFPAEVWYNKDVEKGLACFRGIQFESLEGEV